MCQAVPRRVLEVSPGSVRAEIDGEPRWVRAAAHLDDVKVGDYVVVYAGVALEAIDPEEAEERLGFLRELEAMFPAEERA